VFDLLAGNLQWGEERYQLPFGSQQQ